jgi:hypothetical protein
MKKIMQFQNGTDLEKADVTTALYATNGEDRVTLH